MDKNSNLVWVGFRDPSRADIGFARFVINQLYRQGLENNLDMADAYKVQLWQFQNKRPMIRRCLAIRPHVGNLPIANQLERKVSSLSLTTLILLKGQRTEQT
jgi:hypothetical protein